MTHCLSAWSFSAVVQQDGLSHLPAVPALPPPTPSAALLHPAPAGGVAAMEPDPGEHGRTHPEEPPLLRPARYCRTFCFL